MKTLSVFSNKVAVITGAGSGIGRELARQLAASGANLALADVNQIGLETTVNELHGNSKTTSYVLDVSNREAFQEFVKQVIADHDQVDIVINNAAILRMHSMEKGSYEDFEKSIDINVWGVIYGCMEFLPYLKQRPQAWLVNMSSLAGLVGVANAISYNLSKFAVRGFTESLRNEMRGTNVLVSCVHPGGVKTNISSSGRHSSDAKKLIDNLEKAMENTTAESAAEIILTGMAKNKRRILIGKDARLADILARLFPVGYDRIMARLF